MDPATPEGTQSAGKPRGTNKKERPGGGNGDSVNAKGVRFTKKTEGPGNWYDLLLASAYCVQCRGRATVTDIYDDITAPTRLNCTVHKNTAADALEALKKQEILAEGQDNDGNQVYSMKRFKFNCSPSIAQGAEGLIQELRTDSTGALIIERFTAAKGGGTDTSKSRPCNPVDGRATVVLTNGFLGAQVWDGNDELQENYYEAGKFFTLHLPRHKRMNGNGEKVPEKDGVKIILDRFDSDRPLMFERTFDGRIVACHAHSVQNFFKNAVEGGRPISPDCTRGYHVCDFFGFTDVVVDPKEQQLTFSKRPVMRDEKGPQSKGAGLKYYECLKPGSELEIYFSFPTTNFVTPQQVKFWLERMLHLCIRSMSPARGDQVGTGAKLKKFEVKSWADYEKDWQEI
jgi:hypothetical protein